MTMSSSVISPSLISFVPMSTSASLSASLVSTPTPTSTTEDDDPATLAFPPMTTRWSKPESCTWTYDAGQELASDMMGPIAWLDYKPEPGHTSLSCYPPGMFTEDRTGIFSPATCPSGWTTVSVSQNTDEAAEVATTTAVCCSSEYTLNGAHCYREVPTVLAVPILYNSTGDEYDMAPDETSVLVSATLAVHTIQALFQEGDKEVLGLTYDEEIRTEPRDEGLSLTERVGIGVGAAIAGLLIAGAIAFLLVRRRARQQARKSRYPVHDMANDNGPAFMGPTGVTGNQQHSSLSSYGGATVRPGSMSDDGRDEEVFDGEIEVLKAKKAAIQRRIEELESSETPMEPEKETSERTV